MQCYHNIFMYLMISNTQAGAGVYEKSDIWEK
jgi:hypothetical protein